MSDPEVVLLYAAYLTLLRVTNTYGYVNQARSALHFALKHRGWCVRPDTDGVPQLVPWE